MGTEAQAEFNKSDEGKKYKKAVEVYEKRKKLGEAKAKFLVQAPQKNLGAYQLFLGDKRKEVMAAHPELKGLPAIMGKLTSMWKELSQEKEANKEYQVKLAEFHKTVDYRKYAAVERAVSGKKGNAVKKDDKKKSKGPPPPVTPENMPKQPPQGAYFMLREEEKGSPREVHTKWVNLGASGQEVWTKNSKEANDKYEADMKEFKGTLEGKKYLRLKALHEERQTEQRTKDKFLSGKDAPKEPKKPVGAYFSFVSSKRPDVAKELGTTKMGDIATRVTELWSKLDAEEKKVWTDKADAAKKEY